MVKEILNKPGIYKFLNKEGDILYIGKAQNLKQRVSSYFKGNLEDRPWIRKMMPLVKDIQTIETDNEIEALVLESALIKKYKPKYNLALKDDKSYAWIYISKKEKFPTVKIVRTLKEGEYNKRNLFGPYPKGYTVRKVYSYLRKLYPFCTCKEGGKRNCIYFDIGLCPGPYQGNISKEGYMKNIKEIRKFLSGKKSGHIEQLEKEMKLYSDSREYEKAKILRDRINDLKYIGQRREYDFFETEEEYITKRKKLLKDSFKKLSIELSIPSLKRIECYDISNIQGKLAYGSMVVVEDGIINSNEYRIFRIKTINKPNDPEMLHEVLERRFKNKKMNKYPELVLIDGGKGQLSMIKNVIPNNILILGISKGKHIKKIGGKPTDKFWAFVEDEIKQVKIRNIKILVALRDEAHRFAIKYHRNLRSKVLVG
ncbi:MAG: GIY-YIG nuclease family protein [Candidatus Dojkabacteria bacterium]|nr:GIY-YIG nuclease family protein [Candidatus Dojkabacteria bacterium]